MSNIRKKTNNINRENVLNELLNELDEDEGFEPVENTIKAEINAVKSEEPDDAKDKSANDSAAFDGTAAKPKNKQRFYFMFAIITVLMAIVGVVSVVLFAIDKIKSAADSNSLVEEYTRFLLPVVANDIAPFETENELSNSAKINCSVWNILLNHDTSSYKLSDTGEFLIPEYDVEYSCKEIFGTSSGLVHRTVGSSDIGFSYDSENHVYSCVKDLRYLNYVPVITDMSSSDGIYTLTVAYYSPSVRYLSENIGIEASAEKTMKYIVSRYDGKNTLVAVEFASDFIID